MSIKYIRTTGSKVKRVTHVTTETTRGTQIKMKVLQPTPKKNKPSSSPPTSMTKEPPSLFDPEGPLFSDPDFGPTYSPETPLPPLVAPKLNVSDKILY